jgi:hypothetical protein
VELHFFGQICFETALPDRIPDAAPDLSHGGLLRGIEDLVNREDQSIEFMALNGQLLAAGSGKRVVARPPVVF